VHCNKKKKKKKPKKRDSTWRRDPSAACDADRCQVAPTSRIDDSAHDSNATDKRRHVQNTLEVPHQSHKRDQNYRTYDEQYALGWKRMIQIRHDLHGLRCATATTNRKEEEEEGEIIIIIIKQNYQNHVTENRKRARATHTTSVLPVPGGPTITDKPKHAPMVNSKSGARNGRSVFDVVLLPGRSERRMASICDGANRITLRCVF
jgi:hypothetical protein